MNKTILQTISLQDYVKRLWNHSNTKIPVTIGKGTDTAKPRSKAPYRGNKTLGIYTVRNTSIVQKIYKEAYQEHFLLDHIVLFSLFGDKSS